MSVLLYALASLWAVVALASAFLGRPPAEQAHAELLAAVLLIGAVIADKLDKARRQ